MSTPGTQPLAAGWYPDPAGTGGQRWHDGQGWTAQVVHGTAEVRTLGAGFARLGDWLGRLLAFWGVIYLLLGLLMLGLWAVGPDAFTLTNPDGTPVTTQPDPATGSEGGAVGGAVVAIDAVFFVLYVGTVVAWLVWQYQLAVAAPRRLRHSPTGHVLWWFVPVANLFVPRSAIGDLWHGYDRRQTGQPAEPTPWVFSVWWALWLAPLVLLPLLVLVVFQSGSVDQALSGLLGFSALLMLTHAGSGFAARVVVRDLSWRALLYHSTAA